MNNKRELNKIKIDKYGFGICPQCGKYTYLNQVVGKYYGFCFGCFVADLTQGTGFIFTPKVREKVLNRCGMKVIAEARNMVTLCGKIIFDSTREEKKVINGGKKMNENEIEKIEKQIRDINLTIGIMGERIEEIAENVEIFNSAFLNLRNITKSENE